MRRVIALAAMMAISLLGRAEDWTTQDGKTYTNVQVVKLEDDGVRVSYDGGIGKLPYYQLPDDVHARLSQQLAEIQAKQHAIDDAVAARKQEEAATQQKELQDAQAAAAAALAQQTQPAPAPVATQPSSAVVPPPVAAAAPSATPAPVRAENETDFPGSTFRSDGAYCHLKSPAVSVERVSLTPSTAEKSATLSLEVTTEGPKPTAPDSIIATFVSESGVKIIADDNKVQFLVDGKMIDAEILKDDDSSTTPGTVIPTDYVVFELSPAQAQSIFGGEMINFSVGANKYRVDETGIDLFRKYFADINSLPPPPHSYARSFHRYWIHMPPLTTIISNTCLYFMYSCFTIVCFFALAAGAYFVARSVKR